MNCRICTYWKPDHARETSMRGDCVNTAADKSGTRTVYDYSCRHFQAAPGEAEEFFLSDEAVNGWIEEIPTYQGFVDKLPITSTARLFLTIALTVMQAALEEVQELRAQNREKR